MATIARKPDAGDGEQRELIDLRQRAQDEPPAVGPENLHEKQQGEGREDISIMDGPEAFGHALEINPPDGEIDQQGGKDQARNHFFLHQAVSLSINSHIVPERPDTCRLLTLSKKCSERLECGAAS